MSDGDWHYVTWTRRYKRITLDLDGMMTAPGDLPGADGQFDAAQDPVVSVDIGGVPPGVPQPKGAQRLSQPFFLNCRKCFF